MNSINSDVMASQDDKYKKIVEENILNAQVYIKDARAMELPLVSVGGGEDTIHDWNYLLSQLGILQWDRALGSMAFWTGMAIIALSVALAAYSSFESRDEAIE